MDKTVRFSKHNVEILSNKISCCFLVPPPTFDGDKHKNKYWRSRAVQKSGLTSIAEALVGLTCATSTTTAATPGLEQRDRLAIRTAAGCRADAEVVMHPARDTHSGCGANGQRAAVNGGVTARTAKMWRALTDARERETRRHLTDFVYLYAIHPAAVLTRVDCDFCQTLTT